jgi:hypothetical protein
MPVAAGMGHADRDFQGLKDKPMKTTSRGAAPRRAPCESR